VPYVEKIIAEIFQKNGRGCGRGGGASTMPTSENRSHNLLKRKTGQKRAGKNWIKKNVDSAPKKLHYSAKNP
jgi:hypothetical protein